MKSPKVQQTDAIFGPWGVKNPQWWATTGNAAWTVYIAVAAVLIAVLWSRYANVPKATAGKKATDLPPPKKDKDLTDMSLMVMAHTYSGYAYLILRGKLLDVKDLVFGALCFWRVAGGLKDAKPTSPPLSAKAGPPFNSGWVIFYTRRLYKRIEDCWNRPITGEAATSINVCLRRRDGSGDAAPLVRTGETKRCLNLGSYNYLGFGGLDPTCTPAVIGALRKYGVSSCSSRMEAGHTPLHAELEGTVARFLEKEDALVVGMGFATNSTIIPVIVDAEGNGKGVLLLSDALNHSSIVEGVRGSGAKVVPFAHNNMRHLEAILRRATESGQPNGVPWRKIIIVVEGIYSMEGEFAHLRQIVALKKRFRAYLYLDEAHSIGAVGPRGRGVTDLLGIPTSDVDIMMGTFTKSFGSIGGYIAADKDVIATLRRHAASSLYAAAMSPPAAQQTLSALRLIMGEDKEAGDRGTRRMAQLRENTNRFRAGLIRMGCRVLGDVDSPVIPVMLYHPEKIYNFSQACLRRNLATVVVGYPATPLLLSRARFCIAASHTAEELDDALAKIGEAAQEVGIRYDKGTPATSADDPDAAARARMDERLSASMHGVCETAWVPEPLCCPTPAGEEEPQAAYEKSLALAAKPASALDLRTTDFLNLAAAPGPRAAAEQALNDYGCGTCGPRGFYGTLDVHLELESKLAKFLQTEGAIIYSFGIATPSSVVPAFVRAGDVLFADDGVHFTTAVGIKLSRGRTKYFPHNDMGALEQLLAAQAASDRTKPAAKRPRRFLLAEGLYANGGGVANLPELLRLRDLYGCYLIVDETLSIGTLGARGRGVAEHYSLPPSSIDIIVGSMEHALGSVGGFCAGSAWCVSHQRLSGSGYCFSASLPAFATCAAMAALDAIDSEPHRIAKLQAATAALAPALDAHLATLSNVAYETHPASPIAHVRLGAAARTAFSPRMQERLLREVAEAVASKPAGCATQLMLSSGLGHIQAPRPPSLRLTVHANVSQSALDAAAAALAAELGVKLAEHKGVLAAFVDDVTREKAEAKKAAEKTAALEDASPDTRVPKLLAPGSAGVDVDATTSAASAAAASAAAVTRAVSATMGEGAPPVTVPVLYALELVRQLSRRYVLRQMEWHAFSLAPQLARLRASRHWLLHTLFTLGHFLGSEVFYLTAIPVMCWSLGQEAHINMFVAYFSLNVYVGNWLKNLFALARGPSPDLTSYEDTADFGWPSMYAVNAVGLPFFALRYWFGAFGQGTVYSEHHQYLTAASYTVGILWVLMVCGARLYSGVSTPADVQGGMLVGGVLVRIWLPVCEDVDALLSFGSRGLYDTPKSAVLLLIALLLMLIHPFTPGEPRSWNSLVVSTKAVAFATAFIIGSNSFSIASSAAAPAPTLASGALLLALRNAIGFACLYVSNVASRAISSFGEDAARALLPAKPCAPKIVKSAVVFTASGLMVSYGVPTLLHRMGL